MNIGQDRQIQIVRGNGGNQFRQYVGQNVTNQNGYNALQNVKNQIAKQNLNGNCNVVAARARGNSNGNNDTQTDKAPVYNSDRSAEVQLYENCYNNDIFNMFTQEKQYTQLLEPIPEPHQVQQLDSNVIYEVSSMEQEKENVELEFQIKNYGKENAHLKTAYKNLFDSINVSRAQTKGITNSLQNKLNDLIYENIKLRAQLSDKVSEQKDTTKGVSVNTQFCKQSILGKPPSSSGLKLYSITPFPKPKGLTKIDESHTLSKPVTSN
nr:hypothetical protein [Tanacetum cinerariifolium]